jgi:DNA polymerase-3 subunit beta
MKLTIERGIFLKALSHIQNVVERRNTIPILSNILMQAGTAGLVLTATNSDLEIVESITADVSQEGETTAPALLLYDIVRKLPEGSQIRIETPGDCKTLILQSGRSRFQLGCLDVADFPLMTSSEMTSQFTLPTKELRLLIDRTRFAISAEEARYYLNGIFFHVGQGNTQVLRAVATDGHRLARAEIALPVGAENMPDIILPRKTVAELRKLADDAESIEICLSNTKARFATSSILLTSKLVDGTFPEYERVIPFNNSRIMHVQTRALAAAVDRVSTISSERGRSVKLKIEKGSLTLSASNAEQGNATEEIEVNWNSDTMEIGFNARYLLDITQQIDASVIEFVLADGSAPAIIRSTTDSNTLYVLMPMRV